MAHGPPILPGVSAAQRTTIIPRARDNRVTISSRDPRPGPLKTVAAAGTSGSSEASAAAQYPVVCGLS